MYTKLIYLSIKIYNYRPTTFIFFQRLLLTINKIISVFLTVTQLFPFGRATGGAGMFGGLRAGGAAGPRCRL